MRPHAEEPADGEGRRSISSDGSDSEKSFLGIVPAHQDEVGQDVANPRGTGPAGPGASPPSLNLRTTQGDVEGVKPPQEVVSWRDMPKKAQLVVITLARFSEPLTQTSLQVRSPDDPTLSLYLYLGLLTFTPLVVYVLPAKVVRPQPTYFRDF